MVSDSAIVFDDEPLGIYSEVIPAEKNKFHSIKKEQKVKTVWFASAGGNSSADLKIIAFCESKGFERVDETDSTEPNGWHDYFYYLVPAEAVGEIPSEYFASGSWSFGTREGRVP